MPNSLEQPKKGKNRDWRAVAQKRLEALQEREVSRNSEDPPEDHPDANRTKPLFVSAAEIARTKYSPPLWFVENLLRPGVTVLGGRSGGGKSWLMLQLGLAIANGAPLFERFTVPRARRVLYIALEDDNESINERFALLGIRNAPDDLLFAYDWKLLEAGGLEWVNEAIESQRVEVVVIDTLGKIQNPKRSSNQIYLREYHELGTLEDFARKRNVSLILSTHATKRHDFNHFTERMQGSMGTIAGASSKWFLDAERSVWSGEGRRSPPFEYGVQLRIDKDRRDNKGWVIVGSPAEAMLGSVGKLIHTTLRENGALAVRDLWDYVKESHPAMPLPTLRTHLQRMKRKRTIVILPDHRWALPTPKESA